MVTKSIGRPQIRLDKPGFHDLQATTKITRRASPRPVQHKNVQKDREIIRRVTLFW